jgi:Tc5 transposase DNA-binding domain
MILARAQQVWPLIPQYRGQAPPNFSSGWLDKFKKRHNMNKSRTRLYSTTQQQTENTPKAPTSKDKFGPGSETFDDLFFIGAESAYGTGLPHATDSW